MDALILPEVNAESMSIFLAEVAKHHPDEFNFMVMDQAVWHKANDLEVPENVRLIWQPPCSPQRNPVENIWEEIKEQWSPNRVFNRMQLLRAL